MRTQIWSVVILWSVQGLYGPPLEDAGGPTEGVINIKTVFRVRQRQNRV